MRVEDGGGGWSGGNGGGYFTDLHQFRTTLFKQLSFKRLLSVYAFWGSTGISLKSHKDGII